MTNKSKEQLEQEAEIRKNRNQVILFLASKGLSPGQIRKQVIPKDNEPALSRQRILQIIQKGDRPVGDNKGNRNLIRHSFLLSLFPTDELTYSEIKLNDFHLVRYRNERQKRMEVAIFTERTFENFKKYQSQFELK